MKRLLLLFLIGLTPSYASYIGDFDVVVYGGTSAE